MSTTGSQIELVVCALLGGILVLYLVSLTGIALGRQRLSRSAHVNLPKCRRCGYAISDVTASKCSECGSLLVEVGLQKPVSRKKIGLPLRFGAWTLISLSLVWPVNEVLSSSDHGMATGWWESSFLLSQDDMRYKSRAIQDPVRVSLMCAAVGKMGASVLPNRVLLIIDRPGHTAQALKIDARAGRVWSSDLDWSYQGPGQLFSLSSILESIKRVYHGKTEWSAQETRVLKKQATFIYDFIASLQAVKFDPLSSISPWPHPATFEYPVLEDGTGQRVCHHKFSWLTTASWLITGVLWLGGLHLIWYRPIA